MSRRVLLTLLLLLGFATPTLAQSAGNIDTPAANATVGQPFTINGWAIYQGGSGSGVDVVHVYGCPTPRWTPKPGN